MEWGLLVELFVPVLWCDQIYTLWELEVVCFVALVHFLSMSICYCHTKIMCNLNKSLQPKGKYSLSFFLVKQEILVSLLTPFCSLGRIDGTCVEDFSYCATKSYDALQELQIFNIQNYSLSQMILLYRFLTALFLYSHKCI